MVHGQTNTKLPEIQLYFNTNKIIVEKTPLGVLDTNEKYKVMDRFYEICFSKLTLSLIS
jgi:hypothetical protein